MKIILKYKKTFIAVVMVSLLLAILPAISMWMFGVMCEQDTMVEMFNGYLNDYDYQSSLPEDYVYQVVNLKMDSTANLEQPSWNGNRSWSRSIHSGEHTARPRPSRRLVPDCRRRSQSIPNSSTISGPLPINTPRPRINANPPREDESQMTAISESRPRFV